MSGDLHFYFDFISPYGYFAAERIEDIAARHGRRLHWHPFHMRAVMQEHLGQDKAMADVPLKGAYVRNDVRRAARELALPYAPASTAAFSSVTAARIFWWLQAQQPQVAAAFAKEVFRAHHARTDSPNTVEQCVALAVSVGADITGLAEAAQAEAARQALRDATQAAVQAGVWGTPTVRIGDELFWGSDRLPMVDEWLRRGGW